MDGRLGKRTEIKNQWPSEPIGDVFLIFYRRHYAKSMDYKAGYYWVKTHTIPEQNQVGELCIALFVENEWQWGFLLCGDEVPLLEEDLESIGDMVICPYLQ